MNRKILSPLFALLIFVAHLNCVVEHQIICAAGNTNLSSSLVAPGLPLAPQSDSEECGHGCICKGATVAAEFNCLDFDNSAFGVEFLPFDLTAAWMTAAEANYSRRHIPPVCCIPLRASDRCALLQTFLI